ncbi:unnamed protein product [Symbiodinium sp. CCMP2456]|nr:unnamed protein product [Symbiodinium sp. CCMP2456]
MCSVDGGVNMAAQMQPDECDPDFIGQDIPGGYYQFYKDGCIATMCGRQKWMGVSPWPRQYGMWKMFWDPMPNMWGWAKAIQRKCIVPPEWTRVVWVEEIFYDMVYDDGTNLNWDTSKCPEQTEWTDIRLPYNPKPKPLKVPRGNNPLPRY